MAVAIAMKTRGIKKSLPLPSSFSTATTDIATFGRNCAINQKSPVMSAVVNICIRVSGLVRVSIREESITAVDIATISIGRKARPLLPINLETAITETASLGIKLPIIQNIPVIAMAVIIWNGVSIAIFVSMCEEATMAIDIPTSIAFTLSIAAQDIPPNPRIPVALLAISANLGPATWNIVVIATPVTIWNGVSIAILLSIHEDAVITAERPSNIRKTLPIDPSPAPPILAFSKPPLPGTEAEATGLIAFIIAATLGAITANIAVIAIPVKSLGIDIGLMSESIHEDAVTAAAIITIESAAIPASLNDSFNSATSLNALDIRTIAIPKEITERKSILPTSLNAKPMARTATAIRIIVPIPFFIAPSDFLSPPTFSKTDFSSPFCFCISVIVFCFLSNS